jgi:hypothetical protein
MPHTGQGPGAIRVLRVTGRRSAESRLALRISAAGHALFRQLARREA